MEKVVNKFLKFIFVGVVATILDLTFFNIFFYWTTLFILSRVIGIGLSMIWNFLANRNVTFKAKSGKIKSQLPKYIVVYSIAMSSNVLISRIAFYLLGSGQLNANVAAFIGLCVSIPISFIGSLLWAFNTDKSKNTKNVKKS